MKTVTFDEFNFKDHHFLEVITGSVINLPDPRSKVNVFIGIDSEERLTQWKLDFYQTFGPTNINIDYTLSWDKQFQPTNRLFLEHRNRFNQIHN